MPTSRSSSHTSDECYNRQHLRSSTRVRGRRRPPGSGPAKQRKKIDPNRSSSSTTACVWWRAQTRMQLQNEEPRVKERGKGQWGGMGGGGSPPYIGKGEEGLLPRVSALGGPPPPPMRPPPSLLGWPAHLGPPPTWGLRCPLNGLPRGGPLGVSLFN